MVVLCLAGRNKLGLSLWPRMGVIASKNSSRRKWTFSGHKLSNQARKLTQACILPQVNWFSNDFYEYEICTSADNWYHSLVDVQIRSAGREKDEVVKQADIISEAAMSLGFVVWVDRTHLALYPLASPILCRRLMQWRLISDFFVLVIVNDGLFLSGGSCLREFKICMSFVLWFTSKLGYLLISFRQLIMHSNALQSAEKKKAQRER